MGHATMDHRMIDEALYSNALQDFQKKMQTVHKSVVNLDIKVKKWTVIPEILKDYLLALRKKAAAMNDASKSFLAGKKGGGNPENMESVIKALEEAPVNVPPAWRGMLFSESIRDHVRFNQADEVLAMFKDEAA